MKTNRFTFHSSNGRDVICAREWIPDRAPCGIIQITHGMQEYMKNYERFAEFMCGNDFYVIGLDMLGHGDTAPEGELGYFADADSSEFLVLDMRRLTELARANFPGIPYIMAGHSFGSFLTRIYISRYRDIDGAVLMGSGDSDPRQDDKIMKLIKISLRRHNGKYRSKLVQAAAFGRKLKKFLPLKNSFEWTSRDEKKIKEYLNDKKNNYIFTLNGFITLLAVLGKANEDIAINNTPKQLPILLLSGSNDAIGDHSKGIKRVYDRMKLAGMSGVELYLINDGRHNILQDICYKEAHNTILRWCERSVHI